MEQPARAPVVHRDRPGPRAVAAATVFAVTLVAYVATAARGLEYVDNGELAAVAWTLGIAHPTGYPTLTLLGHLVSRTAPLRPILALNAFAALLVAVSGGLLVLLFDDVLSTLAAPGGRRTGPGPRAAAAACAALATALSATWWDQARQYEAYSLHALMIVLVTTLFLRFIRGGGGGPIFAYVLGLSFTNHMTTLLLAPAFLAHFALTRVPSTRELRRLVGLAPWLLLGLTPYLYLPIRAAAGPRFGWDGPDTVHGFLHLVTAREYRPWLFTDPGTMPWHARFFFGRLPAETGYLGLPVAIVGLAWLIARAPRLALLATLLFATSVVFAGGYGIPDIRPYYLVAVLALGLAMAAGLGWTLHRLGPRAALAAGTVLAALVLAVNFPRRHGELEAPVEGLVRDMLEPLPPNAVVLSNQWDQWMSGSLYLQEVEGLRRDVTVVDSEALGRPWYLKELERRAPELCAPVKPTIDQVLRGSAPPRAARVDADEAPEPVYLELVNALVAASLRDRPVFVTRDAVPRLARGFRSVPQGLAFRVVTDSSDVAQETPRWRFRPERARRDMYGALTCELYARSALDRAYYEVSRGRDSTAARYLDYARSFDPGWRAYQVPPQPWGAADMLARSLSFFDGLRDMDLVRLRLGARRAGLMPGSSDAHPSGR